MDGENISQGGKKKGGTKVVIIVGAVVIVALIGVIVFLLWPKAEEEKRNVVLTKENAEEEIKNMEEDKGVPPGYYTVTMNNTWHFKTGDAPSEDAHVENVERNTNDVYFDIFLAEDENNAIYKSPVIPRGGTLEKIALDKPLEEGTHECVMVYHLVDENQQTVDTLRVKVTLVIEG